MQKFGGKNYFMTIEMRGISIVIVDIMLVIQTTKNLPGMHDRAFLKIAFFKYRIEVNVMTAFISIVPHNNGRMVMIEGHHFFYQFCSGFCVVVPMPAGQFIQYHKSE